MLDKQYGVRNEEQGARIIFRPKPDGAITRNTDAAHRSPDIVSRLGASVEDPPKRVLSFAYRALSCSPLCWSTSSLTPSLCALLRYFFVIYSFPRVDQRLDLDGFHVLSINHPQLISASVVTFLKLLPPYDTSMFSYPARFDLSTPPMTVSFKLAQPAASYSRLLAPPPPWLKRRLLEPS